jgi:glucosamine kinase
VVGADAGGTTTRCAVVTPSGAVAGYGIAPGANHNSGGDTAGALTQALLDALGPLDPLLVTGGVFGIAGAGAAGRPAAVAAARTAWRAARLPGAPCVVTDIAVAFAAGTAEPAGIVIFAGTGAGAAVINDGVVVRRADGYGWLVGDEGSAVWLGREAVRAALAAYDGRGAPTILADTVPYALLPDTLPADLDVSEVLARPDASLTSRPSALGTMSSRSALPQAIVKAVYGAPPAALGRLAPLVSEAAVAGDPVAERIAEEAARHLLIDIDAVRPAFDRLTAASPGTGTPPPAGGRSTHGAAAAPSAQATSVMSRSGDCPVVMAGSLLNSGPVAEAVRAGLRDRFAADPTQAGDGALGAAHLALRRLALR